MLTTWSEEVAARRRQRRRPYSLSASGWAIEPGGIGAAGPSDHTRDAAHRGRREGPRQLRHDGLLRLQRGRRRSSTPRRPPNDALDGTKTADPRAATPASSRTTRFGVGSPRSAAADVPAFERKCAFDDDWYRFRPARRGLSSRCRPGPSPGSTLGLRRRSTRPATRSLRRRRESGAAGEVDRLTFAGSLPPDLLGTRARERDRHPAGGPVLPRVLERPAEQAGCGPLAGQIVFTEAGFGNDKFLEIKNDAEVPVDMEGANAKVSDRTRRRRCASARSSCRATDAESILAPDEHVLIETTAAPPRSAATQIPCLGPRGERMEIAPTARSTASRSGHDQLECRRPPLAPVRRVDGVTRTTRPTTTSPHDWCRTFAADTKGAIGDGCDEYRINEVLWRPTSSAATSDGRAFVEIAGNIPALAELRATRRLGPARRERPDRRRHRRLRARRRREPALQRHIRDRRRRVRRDPGGPVRPDLGLAQPELCRCGRTAPARPARAAFSCSLPNPPSAPPCTGSADAFGWTTTAQGFATRSTTCAAARASRARSTRPAPSGSSAARDNLSSALRHDLQREQRHGQQPDRLLPAAHAEPGRAEHSPELLS